MIDIEVDMDAPPPPGPVVVRDGPGDPELEEWRRTVLASRGAEPLASPDRMATHDPNTCDHDGGKAWDRLPVPNEHQCRCSLCGALGYTRSRSRGPRRKNARPPKVMAYSCRVKGCTNAVIERRYTTGFELANGCSEHPVRTKGAS